MLSCSYDAESLPRVYLCFLFLMRRDFATCHASICAFLFLCRRDFAPCLSVLSCSYEATCHVSICAFLFCVLGDCFLFWQWRSREDSGRRPTQCGGPQYGSGAPDRGGGPSKLFLLNLWWASLDPHTTYYYKTPHVNKNKAIWEVFDNMKKITTI